MIRFRSIPILLVVAALAVSARAQGTTGGLLYASDFANWTLPQGNTPAQGAIFYPNQDICKVTSNGYTFLAPKVGRPITIVDGANTETVTPTSVVVGSIGCSISAIMAHSHSSYFLKSGTGGAQEAVDYQASQPQGANIVLTPTWTAAGGSTGIITSTLKGNTGVTILDQRTSQLTAYTWNGSSYIPNAFATIAGGSTIGNCATILSTNTVGTTGAPCGTAGNPAGPAFAVQLSNSGVNSFQGDPNITINPTTHTLTSANLLGGTIQGAYQADQQQTGGGNNGIANSVTALGGAAGTVIAPPNYGTTEIPQGVGDNVDQFALPWPSNTGMADWRSGMFNKYCSDPQSFLDSFKYCSYELSTFTTPNPNGTHIQSRDWQDRWLAGGNQMFASGLAWTGYSWPAGRGKSALSSLAFRNYKYTKGQYNVLNASSHVNGEGDAPVVGLYTECNGQSSKDGDENCGHIDLQSGEGVSVFQGTVTGTPAVGATQIQTTATSGANSQGEGRYLIVTSAGTSTGTLTGSFNPVEQDLATDCTTAANYTASSCIPGGVIGTGFSASTFIGVLSAKVTPSSSAPPIPGTETVVVTPMSGFALASLSAGQLLCAAGNDGFYETTTITAINTSTGALTAFWNKPHAQGSMVAVGGQCGKFIDINAYDVTSGTTAFGSSQVTLPIHHVFPVIATKADASAVYVFNRDYGVKNGFPTPHWGTSTCLNITAATRTSGTVTATLSGLSPWVWYNYALPITGMTDPTFNSAGVKVFAQTTSATATATVITYANAGANASSSGGQICQTNNGYTLYDGAEVTSVFNTTTKAVDGSFTVLPNAVAWTGVSVELPHGFNQNIPWRGGTSPSIEYSHFQVPARAWGMGVGYQGVTDGQGVLWYVGNLGSNSSALQNHGGFVAGPRGIEVNGYVLSGFGMQNAPEVYSGLPSEAYENPGSVISVGCRANGCSEPNTLIHEISQQSASGWNTLDYDGNGQTWILNNASNRNFQLGNTLYLGGAKNLTNFGSGMAVGGALGNAQAVALMIAPDNNPATDGSLNRCSNDFDLLGGYGDGTNVQAEGVKRQVCLGTGTSPTITETTSCASSGSVGTCILDSSGADLQKLPGGAKLSIGGATGAAGIVGQFSGCSGTQYLGADGACHTPPSTTTICRYSTPVTNTGSTAQTLLQSCLIPGGTIGANGTLDISFGAFNGASNTGTCTYSVTFGTASTAGNGTGVSGTGALASNRPVSLRGTVQGANTTASVLVSGFSIGNSVTTTSGGAAAFTINTAANTFVNWAVTNSVSGDSCIGVQGTVVLRP